MNYQWIRHLTFEPSTPGELPPPPPRAIFGREELTDRIIGLVDNFTPVALIGAGGIGKTYVALTVLHHNRVKQRFGDHRRFIRCDQFPASTTHFLNRLSAVIGAGVQNPEDLAPLRPFLSSREILIVLDNAESILDPEGMSAEEIYAIVEELAQFDNICLCITSRISTIPPDCEVLEVPTLSMEAARSAFYNIYQRDESSDVVDNIMERLDFHPLSVTLLATVGRHNRWDVDRLTKEWENKRTAVLKTRHNKSLAATIELSLASPLFQGLGPDARGILGVIAFFPQGVDENNIEWLFPNIPDGPNIFDVFCVLSLAHQSNGFITMLAPLRDHLCPKEPRSSPLLYAAKDHYFGRLSVGLCPGKPGYEEARWIKLEDVNVEHLLDVFTTIDMDSNNVWDVCSYFMEHLTWHKPRLVLLGPKFEALPDSHPSKPRCLSFLSHLFSSIGSYKEWKRLLNHTLKLWRERGDDVEVAETLRYLSNANRLLRLHNEGIQQAKEALEIYERLDHTPGRASALGNLAQLLYGDQQLNAAAEAASQSIDLLPEKVDGPLIGRCHRLLGKVHSSKGEMEKAINHFEAALRIGSSSNFSDGQFWVHYNLAELFFTQGKFDDSDAHIEHAKSHVGNDMYLMGRATYLQARFWYKQQRVGEARSEALCAIDTYEKIGYTRGLELCRALLCGVEKEIEKPISSGGSDFKLDTSNDGELP